MINLWFFSLVSLATFNKDGHASSLRRLLHLASRAHALLVLLLSHCPFFCVLLISQLCGIGLPSGLGPQTPSSVTHSHVILSSLMHFNHVYTGGKKFISLAPTSLLKIPTWMLKIHLKLPMSNQTQLLPLRLPLVMVLLHQTLCLNSFRELRER